MGGGKKLPSDENLTLEDRHSDDAVEVIKKPGTMGKNPVQGRDPLGAERSESVVGERASSVGEETPDQPERAKLLYSKSKVYLVRFSAILSGGGGAPTLTPPPIQHPSSYLRDNIPGFISIVQVGTEYLLAWIPEAAIEGTPDYESYVLVELCAQPDQETLVTLPPQYSSHAFSLPIRTIYSILVQPPTLSAWFGSATFNIFDSSFPNAAPATLPPLYFHDEESRSTVLDRDRRAEALSALGSADGSPSAAEWSPNGGHPVGTAAKIPPSWGGEALLGQLRQYAHVVRSQLEPQLFLLNPSRADLEVHSTALWEDETVPNEQMHGLRIDGASAGIAGGRDSREAREAKRTSILHQSLGSSDYPDEVGPGMDNFTFNVLNSFSRITRGARSAAQTAAQSVLSHPLAKPILKNVPQPIAHLANAPGELTRLQESAGVGHYDAARVYLAKWARIVAEEGERARRAEVIYSGPGGREIDSEVGAFEVLASTYKITRPKSTRASATPIVVTEWAAWFDDNGRLMLGEDEAKKRIFQRGLADDVRKDIWPFLLEVYPWTSTTQERVLIKANRTTEYERLKAVWFDNKELKASDHYLEESHRIDIDCRRTDRTHPLFTSSPLPDNAVPVESPHPPSNRHVRKTQEILTTYVFALPERDYVQGMSDLLSPIYVVAEADEVMAYWGFCTLMERMKGNFLRDQSGMKKQLSDLQGLLALMDPGLHKHLEQTGSLNLFFCFRWILCSFKRELSFEETLKLWEVLWTDHLGHSLHLFVALAIIESHRDVIMRYLQEFDEVLKYVNELSGTLEIDGLLADAEVLYLTFAKVIEAMDKRKAQEKEKKGLTAAPSAAGLRRRTASEKGKGKEGDEEKEKDDGDRVAEAAGAESPELEDHLRLLLK